MKSLRSLLKLRQQDNNSTEGISDILDSVLLNLNLASGNMHPEELQAKDKVINTSCSDEDTAVTVDYKLMGTLLIDSAIYKKHGDLNMLLINSMNHGNNHYHNIKAAAYTLL